MESKVGPETCVVVNGIAGPHNPRLILQGALESHLVPDVAVSPGREPLPEGWATSPIRSGHPTAAIGSVVPSAERGPPSRPLPADAEDERWATGPQWVAPAPRDGLWQISVTHRRAAALAPSGPDPGSATADRLPPVHLHPALLNDVKLRSGAAGRYASDGLTAGCHGALMWSH